MVIHVLYFTVTVEFIYVTRMNNIHCFSTPDEFTTSINCNSIILLNYSKRFKLRSNGAEILADTKFFQRNTVEPLPYCFFLSYHSFLQLTINIVLFKDQKPETNNFFEALMLHFWYLEYAFAALVRIVSAGCWVM